MSSAGQEAGNFPYYLEQLLQELDERSDVDDGEIARLEWAYCPFLRHSSRSFAALHRMMNGSPAFFAEVVGLVYRPSPESGITEEEAEPTEARRAVAERAYQLLSEFDLLRGSVELAGDEKSPGS